MGALARGVSPGEKWRRLGLIELSGFRQWGSVQTKWEEDRVSVFRVVRPGSFGLVPKAGGPWARGYSESLFNPEFLCGSAWATLGSPRKGTKYGSLFCPGTPTWGDKCRDNRLCSFLTAIRMQDS